MRQRVRFLVGVCLGGGGLLVYSTAIGTEAIIAQAASLEFGTLLPLLLLVVTEGLADGIGVWASVAPLGTGLTGPQSAQFALAGDFFDILSPAGSVTSEPIMAQFIGVATGTTYSEALGVRGVAKYVKAAGQVLLSVTLGLVVLWGNPSASAVLATLALAVGTVAVLGLVVLVFRGALSRIVVTLLTPLLARASGLYREDPHDRDSVSEAVARFWNRVGGFRSRPGLLGLIALAGIAEQVLVAVALWYLLGALGTTVGLLPILVIVPLPQAATVVPIPASLGTYDVLLSGAVTLTTGASAATAATAVLAFRAVTILFGVSVGGLCVAFLRGWRPT